jgi:hypothetical protein
MNKNELVEAIKSAFSDSESKEYATEYLNVIRTNWRTTEEAIRTPVFLMVVLAAAFMLLQGSTVKGISFGSFQFSEYSFIQKIIPALIAYNFYFLSNLALMQKAFRIIHASTLGLIQTKLVEHDIEKFLGPPYFSIFGDLTFMSTKYRFYKAFQIFQVLFVLIVVFGSLIFVIYAYWWLFGTFGTADLVTWFSLVVAVLLAVMGLLITGALP